MLGKRSAVWMLLFVLIFSVIASGCNNSNKGTTPDTPAVEQNETGDTGNTEDTADPAAEDGSDVAVDDGAPPVQDLGGYTFVVADSDQNRWFPKEGSSDLANAIIERIKWVESTYNVKIERRDYNEDEFSAAVLAGDKYADIIITETWGAARHINGKRVVDLKTVPNLNISKPYWQEYGTAKLFTYNNKTFGVAAPFANSADQVWSVAFNKKIIEELGLENPYDLVAKNEWTFDKMLEMQKAAKRDLNGDGVFDSNDRYGLATGHDWDVAVSFYLSSGNKIIEEKPDGSLKYAVNTPKAYETIDMLKQMLKKGDTFFPKNDGEDMDAYVKAFVDGKVLFIAYSRGYGVLDPLFNMEDDFGFVPMPRGNNTDTYLNWVSHNAPALEVPVTNKDLDKTGLIMEALAWKAQQEEQIRLDEISFTQLRDDQSVETIRNLKNTGVSDLAFIGQQMQGNVHAGLALLPDVGFYNQDLEAVSKVAEIEEAVNIGLEELVLRLKGEYVEPEPEAAE